MMVLSRKANDQNRTILVIYSNHPPTNFGIITLFLTKGVRTGPLPFSYIPVIRYTRRRERLSAVR